MVSQNLIQLSPISNYFYNLGTRDVYENIKIKKSHKNKTPTTTQRFIMIRPRYLHQLLVCNTSPHWNSARQLEIFGSSQNITIIKVFLA